MEEFKRILIIDPHDLSSLMLTAAVNGLGVRPSRGRYAVANEFVLYGRTKDKDKMDAIVSVYAVDE